MKNETENRSVDQTLQEEPGATTFRKITSWALVPVRKAMAVPYARLRPSQIDLRLGHEDAETLVEHSNRRLIVWSLIIVVLLPVLASGLYLFAIASDQYSAETRFAVRTLTPSSSGGKGDDSVPGCPRDAGIHGRPGCRYRRKLYHSRAIIDDISKHVDVRAIFRRPEADFLMRLSKDASAEDLAQYWNRMVSVVIEASSGIVTVDVRAFRRDDALLLAKAILESSEALVEDLSSHVRKDMVEHAEREVQRSETLVHSALADLQNYRNTEGLIDPVKNADATGKLLMQLMSDKIQAESQLFVSQRTTGPDAPGVAPLRAKLDSINSQIAELQRQMAGAAAAKDIKPNLAALISRFEELDLKRQFAERIYSLTQEGLTRARLMAERRAVYLSVFVPPIAASGLFLSFTLFVISVDLNCGLSLMVLRSYDLGLCFGSQIVSHA